MLFTHSPIAFGQPPKQDEQQLLVAQGRAASQSLAHVFPALHTQAPIHGLAKQCPQQRARDAGDSETRA
ncbi:hypothetical protein D3C79_797990 [compost metagenome]